MRLVPLLALAAAVACTEAPRPSVDPEDVAPLEYRLDAPDAVVDLPAELNEVSGLTVLPSGRLGAVQDEEGTIYEIDPATGTIVDRLPFEGAGDFEGLALVPDRAVWALRSDGDVYRVFRDSVGVPAVRKVETALRSRNDTEGLAYDPVGDRLLIACKEWPGPDIDDARAVYAFDLATETVSERPVFALARADVDSDVNFRPSAIAVHPSSGQIYVLSSVRRAIAVVDRDGTLVAVTDLPAEFARQPEGLAFADDGTLYVASEGGAGTATLLRYTPTAP
ncbi:SdiA-regulated domain-containing protein [Rubrivirga sp. IMCC45206]|uniref:SdiA-regulated domain-containing protein n=1 Tax=Rubrivirga sp. IMCC45206 TaxID=3391614 RepID=UPI00398FA7C8